MMAIIRASIALVLALVAVVFAFYGLFAIIKFETGKWVAAEGIAIGLCLLAVWLSPDDWRTRLPK